MSRLRKKEQAIWQRLLWEHQVKNDKDYQAYCDYVHYNPVKHGLVKRPKDRAYSSFHRCVESGVSE